MKSIKSFITKQYLSKLDLLSISVDSIINNFYMGSRKSNKTGTSLEFSDFKQYLLGDETKRIDWNIYARNKKLYVKRFKDEVKADINLILDTSTSMDYGNENKGYYSKLIAASIIYIAVKNADNVNIFVCNDKINFIKKRINNIDLYINIINFLDDIKFEGKTNLSKIISTLPDTKIKQGVNFILSDFFLEDEYKKSIKCLKYKKQQVALIHIVSPQEIFYKPSGDVKFIDSETGEICEIVLNDDTIYKYSSIFKNFQNDLKEFCHNLDIAYKFISTDEPIIEMFKNFT